MGKKHNERCAECKKQVHAFLRVLFGNVVQNHDFQQSTTLEPWKVTRLYNDLEKIQSALQDNRGFIEFIKAKKLPKVDYFIDGQERFIVEFDESQHFTFPRELALQMYPNIVRTGFDKERWISLCQQLHRKDNDPPYRDEQRAWYDTIRDFIPYLLDLQPTRRIYAGDHAWCEMDVENEKDLRTFKSCI